MVNYQNGKIYKIECNKTGLVYIGSTCQPTLARRLAEHRAKYNCYLKGKCNYISSFKILENNDYNIILIENCPCNNKDELYVKERYWINNMNCVNKIKNIGLINELGKEYYNKQRYEANKEQIKEKVKEYYEENKDKIKEKVKEYREANKEQIKENKKEYYEANKEQIKENKKEYYEANKEKIKENKKEYREANKEKIKDYNKQRYEANKEQMKEYHKQYYEANKDKLKEYYKQRYEAKKEKLNAIVEADIHTNIYIKTT